jgi:amino acid transporter
MTAQPKSVHDESPSSTVRLPSDHAPHGPTPAGTGQHALHIPRPHIRPKTALPPAEFEIVETVRGSHPGDRYLRTKRQPYFRRTRFGHLLLRDGADKPRQPIGRAYGWLKRLVIGRPLATAEEPHERVNVFTGVAVFASDNISSSAYASEEIMRVLVLAGVGALALTLPITLAIVLVLAIVVLSYQQTIQAYPNGGGSYIVSSENLGTLPGLIAAAALLTDYVLTVSVSVAAGVAALTSIFPALFAQRVALGVGFVAVLCLGNLRGIRESAVLFTAPTYVYLVAIFGLLGYGLWLFATGSLPSYEAPLEWQQAQVAEPLGLLLILRAMASGSVALTGTEAVSNGVPAFKPPEPRHARIVLLIMGSCFGSIFLAISFLAGQLGILPDPSEQETVISQLTRTLVGRDTPYHYLVQLSTALLLVLAANTAFADFPRLSSILARDRFLPRVFAFRGDRLAFSGGIIVLALLAASLIVAFQGSVANLIPLYTIGVFLAFTLSQTGMVRHWWRLRQREQGWRWRAAFNGLGATATAVVTVVVGVAKFALGAWMVLALVPLLVAMMWGIRRHYLRLERGAQRPETPLDPAQIHPRVIVPIARLDLPARQALAFARAIAGDRAVRAVHVADSAEAAEHFHLEWDQWPHGEAGLVLIESPYRSLAGPVLAYIDTVHRAHPDDTIVVVLPEYVPGHWWEQLLHNQTALRLKATLLFHPGVIVANVPYHLGRRAA